MKKKWKMDLLLKYKNPPKINSEGFIKKQIQPLKTSFYTSYSTTESGSNPKALNKDTRSLSSCPKS